MGVKKNTHTHFIRDITDRYTDAKQQTRSIIGDCRSLAAMDERVAGTPVVKQQLYGTYTYTKLRT